jgi:uncharacterized DUF497 family protein
LATRQLILVSQLQVSPRGAGEVDEYTDCIYTLRVIDWDQRKRQANLRKHGFDFVDAGEVFDGVTFTYEDDRISYGEQRFVTLGSLRGNVVSIVHTEQGDHIRVFSMRKATKRECEIYFQSIPN